MKTVKITLPNILPFRLTRLQQWWSEVYPYFFFFLYKPFEILMKSYIDRVNILSINVNKMYFYLSIILNTKFENEKKIIFELLCNHVFIFFFKKAFKVESDQMFSRC